jgi:hypothetical protein
MSDCSRRRRWSWRWDAWPARGLEALNSPTGQFLGYPAPVHFFLAFVATIASAGDIRMIRRGGISGAPRIARHLWRMCFAFFEATSAFFIGKQKVFLMALQGSPVLVLLGVAPLILMGFWLIRVRFTNWFARTAVAS